MKSTRSRKICSVLGVLVCLVVLVASTISVGAIPIAGDTYPISMPTVNMSFAYRVFDTPLLEGEHHPYIKYSFYTMRVNSDITLNEDGRYEFVPYWSASTTFRYNGDDFNNMNLNFTQALNLNSISCEIEEFNGGFDYEQTINVYSYLTPMPDSADLVNVTFTVNDFYVYGNNVDDMTLTDGTPINMRVSIPRTAYNDISLVVVYSRQGQLDILYETIDEYLLYDDYYVYFDVDGEKLGIPSSEIAYVHSATLIVTDWNEYDFPDVPFSRTLDEVFQNKSFSIDIQGTCLELDTRAIDVGTHTIDYEFQNYVDWLVTGVGGFFQVEIFGGITFGGILAMVLGFMGVIWFLKLFAGG